MRDRDGRNGRIHTSAFCRAFGAVSPGSTPCRGSMRQHGAARAVPRTEPVSSYERAARASVRHATEPHSVHLADILPTSRDRFVSAP
ncbi:hypothetical protein CZ774_11445 [Frigoribacterium sp. JB110]|nr:hypothetical protein CZ774_11445 [Frigoribacterium sp. JB110]